MANVNELLASKKAYRTALDFDKKKFMQLAKDSNILLCMQCGTCTASCESGRWTALKTRAIVRKAVMGDLW